MNNEIEIWKDVVGWEGYYQVSSLGRIKTLRRNFITKHGRKKICKEKIRSLCVAPTGYPLLRLSRGGARESILVHRMVAKAFLENPENKKEVNHKNGIKDDNRIENLEWVTPSENIKHSYVIKLRKPPLPNKGKFGAANHSSKQVAQLNRYTYEIVSIFGSVKEAERETKINHSGICAVCNNKRETAGNYRWGYV